MQNANHSKALTLIDESTLPQLKLPQHLSHEYCINADSKPGTSAHDQRRGNANATNTILPKPCPLIPLGLDRSWLVGAIGNIEESLDCMNSITIKPVSNMQSAIAQLHRESY